VSTGKDLVLRWLLPATAAIAAGGFFLFWQSPSSDVAGKTRAEKDVSAKETRSTGRDATDLYAASESSIAPNGAPDSGLTRQRFSAAHVNLDAFRQGDKVRVELDIEPGWHINANPASFDFLIPTEVDVLADNVRLAADVAYPTGNEMDVGLDSPIRVYSGTLNLTITLAERADIDRATVEADIQACNDSGLCLPPSTLSASLVGSAASP